MKLAKCWEIIVDVHCSCMFDLDQVRKSHQLHQWNLAKIHSLSCGMVRHQEVNSPVPAQLNILAETNSPATRHCRCQQRRAAYNSPLKFWQKNAGDFPVLSHVARRVFCISASSAQSERDFSSVGNTITDIRSRSRLSDRKVESVELIRWGMRAGFMPGH